MREQLVHQSVCPSIGHPAVRSSMHTSGTCPPVCPSVIRPNAGRIHLPARSVYPHQDLAGLLVRYRADEFHDPLQPFGRHGFFQQRALWAIATWQTGGGDRQTNKGSPSAATVSSSSVRFGPSPPGRQGGGPARRQDGAALLCLKLCVLWPWTKHNRQIDKETVRLPGLGAVDA
jgi:hypothetical protein